MQKPLEEIIDDIYTLPLVPTNGIVVFPDSIVHFDITAEPAIKALNRAMETDQMVFFVNRRDSGTDAPAIGQLYNIGTVTKVRQVLKLPGEGVRILAEGKFRAELMDILSDTPHQIALVKEYPTVNKKMSATAKFALIRHVKELFKSYVALLNRVPNDIIEAAMSIQDISSLADYLAANIHFTAEEKQTVLDTGDSKRRLELVAALLTKEHEILSLDRDIHERVRRHIDQNQREYYIREQLRILHEELDGEDSEDEIDELNYRAYRLSAPSEVTEKLFKEIEKLAKMPGGSHEATVSRNYIDTILNLPWGKYTKDKIDLAKAEKLLNAEHYSMEKVKERILEMFAVRTLVPDITGQIICLAGPPGVGKTSIAKSIAKCMGRKYTRLSLGGVRDESDIRGHRKTYIGAMPGRVTEAIRLAGSMNPLILLDEIDKLGSDFRGDPSAALLEALDAEQNSSFRDHYLEVPLDLSKVLFITTANNLDTIPPPLLDRMEVIHLSSYTREDKYQIAKRHLLLKQLKKHGLTASKLKIQESAIYSMIDFYTREAGVRKLERTIAALCRKSAKTMIDKNLSKVSITAENIGDFLGVKKYKPEQIANKSMVGVVNGLAWTSVGGEIMQLETAVYPGTGKIVLTGSLGDVMKESAQTAVSFVRGIAADYRVSPDFYKDKDIHIHATENAVPKDGPSAGIAMATALLSALSGMPIRRDVAMTGEISLLGRVLPIGGLKEKTMAAYRAGVKTVIIPEENRPDIDELDKVVRENIEFIPVENAAQVFKMALIESTHAPDISNKEKPFPQMDMNIPAPDISGVRI